MGITLYLLIGLLLIISITGVLIYLNHKSPIDGKNKVIVITIVTLQIVYIFLYFTGALAMICETNVYLGFTVCVLISLICLLLSIWLILPFSKFRNAIKYLFAFFAVIQALTTVVIFLLSEAGMLPLIQL